MKWDLLLGLSAAFFTTFAFMPQAIKTIKTQNTQGISMLMYLMFTTGVVLWAIYGFVRHDAAVFLANVTVFLFAFPVLLVILKNYYALSRQKKKKEQ
ncbi:MAG: SemiSWEET transporter [Gammaproteobacteria bacterium]|nr:SemiSWEET transporter [Gammaproteobacteria bacterium]